MSENESHFHNLVSAIEQVGRALLGKETVIRQAFACLLAGGHLLLDDVPGTGKTTLARTLAHTLGMSFHRVQFTSDLLPADILGVSIYDPAHQHFRFHQGPVFAQLLLADEINRAPPRTQSALLEAMAEHQVTVDGTTHALPVPFFVVATQNPVDLSGTFPLPDSQLDRFLVRLHIGYPDAAQERDLLTQDGTESETPPPALLKPHQIVDLQRSVRLLTATPAVIDYVQRLVSATRSNAQIRTGLSPRAGVALLRMARAWAFLEGRSFVTPEDVQAVFTAVAGHRLVWKTLGDPASQVERLNALQRQVEAP